MRKNALTLKLLVYSQTNSLISTIFPIQLIFLRKFLRQLKLDNIFFAPFHFKIFQIHLSFFSSNLFMVRQQLRILWPHPCSRFDIFLHIWTYFRLLNPQRSSLLIILITLKDPREVDSTPQLHWGKSQPLSYHIFIHLHIAISSCNCARPPVKKMALLSNFSRSSYSHVRS